MSGRRIKSEAVGAYLCASNAGEDEASAYQALCDVNEPKPIDPEAIVLNLDQASRLSSFCYSTLYKHMRSGALAYTKVGGRLCISRESLENLILGSPPDVKPNNNGLAPPRTTPRAKRRRRSANWGALKRSPHR